MRALIALAGLTVSADRLRQLKAACPIQGEGEAFAVVVAADGGLDLLRAVNLVPDFYYGDSDSATRESLDWARHKKVSAHRFPAAKDFTDGQAAVMAAVEAGCDDLLIWSSLGDLRPDHVLANIIFWASLVQQKKVNIVVTDGCQSLTYATPERPFQLEVKRLSEAYRKGYFSLIPLFDRCEGVTLKGFRYPLSGASIPVGSTLGVSNRVLPEAGLLDVQLTAGTAALYFVAEDHSAAGGGD